MARTLVANNDLVRQFAAGRDQAPEPCTYCNKCLVHVVAHPIGCYEEKRYPSREAMLQEVMSVFHPPAFS
jgi:2,4-dienoyl-CoA reductase (NADPH2)